MLDLVWGSSVLMRLSTVAASEQKRQGFYNQGASFQKPDQRNTRLNQPTLRFEGLADDLKAKKRQEDLEKLQQEKQKAYEARQALIPKQYDILKEKLLDAKGQPLTGYELLELMEELKNQTRKNPVRNLQRLGLILGSIALIPTLIGIGGVIAMGENGTYSYYFRSGPTGTTLRGLLGQTESEFSSKMRKLLDLGLIRCVANKEHWADDYYYYVTPTGRQMLQDWQQGRPEVSVEPAKTAMVDKDKLEKTKKAASILTGDLRLASIQALAVTDSVQGLNGWELLQNIQGQEKKLSSFTRWMKPGVVQKNIPGETASMLPRLLELQRLGFLERVASKADAAQNRWRLTSKANRLLSQSDAAAALAITSKDIKELAEIQLKALETEKKGHLGELESVEKVFGTIQAELTKLQSELGTTESATLALDGERQQLTEPAAQEKLERELQEKLFQVKLLEKKVQFKTRQLSQTERQLTFQKTFYTQWTQRAHATMLGLHETVMKAEEHQGEAHIGNLLENLNAIETRQNTVVAQLNELLAMTEPPKTEKKEQEDIQANIILNQELSTLDVDAQLAALRKKHQAPSGGDPMSALMQEKGNPPNAQIHLKKS